MGPETPPRRSKSDQEPLTIDLDATAVPREGSDESTAAVEREASVDETAEIRAGEADETVRADVSGNDTSKSEAEEEDARPKPALQPLPKSPYRLQPPPKNRPGRSTLPSTAPPILAPLPPAFSAA
ncbi:hypothetical protein LP421_22390 [Rhizobium sp. RCAM05350]|nr:hypothetical protein LP421_22390 [Rhizobium sp. RCAM05350]